MAMVTNSSPASRRSRRPATPPAIWRSGSKSRGETLLLLSDAAHLPWLFVRHPDWSLMFDMDPQTACETRRRLLAEAADKGWRVAGYHWGLPNIGHLRRDADGFGFIPLPWP